MSAFVLEPRSALRVTQQEAPGVSDVLPSKTCSVLGRQFSRQTIELHQAIEQRHNEQNERVVNLPNRGLVGRPRLAMVTG